MVSDSHLVTRLREILRDSDLDTATAGSVRRQLEEDFGVDLSGRKAFVSDQIGIFLETLTAKPEEVGGGGEVVGESENVEQEVEENEVLEEEKESHGKDRRKGGSNEVDKGVKKRGGGFNKLCGLSPQLQKIVGVPELARTQVVKKIWAYIRENDLQDPKNKRNIRCDESLRALFHVNSINMFQMNKALSKHIWPLSMENDMKQRVKCEESGSSVSEGNVGIVEEQEEEDEEEKEQEEDEEEVNEPESKKRGPAKEDKNLKKNRGGFNKQCRLSPQLQTVTGVTNLARPEVVKRLWAYIREKNLQDPKNKRNIICDKSLHALFRVHSINMFRMNKVLSKHIWPLNEEDGASDDSSQKEKRCKNEQEEGDKVTSDSDEPKKKGKRQKKGGSGLLACLPLSDALIKFLGTGEKKLSRTDVVKRMWDYIKQNDLQDPSDKRRIICDDKLKELFEVDTFIGFTVSKLLTAHFNKSV